MKLLKVGIKATSKAIGIPLKPKALAYIIYGSACI
jgi:hypothetical protein